MAQETVTEIYKKQSTEELMNRLKSAKDFGDFSNRHQHDFISTTLPAYIQMLIKHKGLSKTVVIKRADLDRVYGYQIISGKRMPTREKLLQLSFGLGLDIEGVQELLKIAGMAPLYAKIKREAAVIYCLNKGYGFMDTQYFLEQAGQRIIGE
ncbi:MAG: hypothetical protein PHO15_07365 [Eubacteriales bacterium]|nr:hypothetical protein [Eubacteriales bacterium]